MFAGREDESELVDEAQNLPDSTYVEAHLDALHGGITGRTSVVLACFGLANTTERLHELGLSRLADGHVKSIGPLPDADAERTVKGTLEIALAPYTFDNGQCNESRRKAWVDAAAAAILAESANFPQHLTNGCRVLARIVLDKGIENSPPIEQLRNQCRERKHAYYNARLRPWSTHTTALAHAFADNAGGWTPIEDVLNTLMASDNRGKPVDEDAALSVFDGMCANGLSV